MKKLLLFICLLFFKIVFGQKQDSSTLYVVFQSNVMCEESNKNITQIIPELRSISTKYSVNFKKGVNLSKEKKKHLEKCANKVLHSKSTTKLDNIYIVCGKNLNNKALFNLKTTLEKLPQVSYCYLSYNKTPFSPSIISNDIPPKTPDFFNNQGYIQSNPGVNMKYAWDNGYNGSGININHVEFSFNKDHEDLVNTNIVISPDLPLKDTLSSPLYKIHGTGAIGVVYAQSNGFGVTGLAYGADKLTFYSEFPKGAKEDTIKDGVDTETIYRINAISKAIEDAKSGDIIIYEMQAFGFNANDTLVSNENKDLVPAEYNKIIWELTKSATDAGITVVAAAGNGDVDLDGNNYKEYMGRGDSGAIIVGAGWPSDHSKIKYSTYGSRVNLQGWGEYVWTTGNHGYNYPPGTCTVNIFGEDENQSYTSCYRGTSSATAIVAGCVAVLQSYYFAQTGNHLTALEIRNILQSTGTAQGSGGNIGPLPNMQAAIEKINADYLLSVASNEFESNFVAYPNPAKNTVYLTLPDYFANQSTLTVYNSLGQKVIEQNLNQIQETVDLNALPVGIYTFSISNGKTTAIKRVVKN